MRRLVYALSLSTLFFAVCTAYLARELYLERADESVTPVAASPAKPALVPAPAANTAVITSNTAAAAAAPQEPASPAAASVSSPAQPPQESTATRQMPPEVAERIARQVGERLALFADPVRKAAMIEERKNSYRTMYPGLQEYLKMDDTEYERFIDFRSRGELVMEEASLRCYAEGTCNASRRMDRTLVEAHKREMADLFGPEKLKAFEFYLFSGGERETVSTLRGRLPDKHRLMDSQSDALVAAFHEERKRIQEESQQRGVQVNNFNNVIYTPMIGETPDDNAMQAAEEYNRRLRDRAATVLTPEQLVAYENMQKEAMQNYKSIQTHQRD